jgi:P4 family phage/plasmid primase-like protien
MDLLDKFFTRNDEFFTHVGLDNFHGKYYLSSEKKDLFFNEYQRRIESEIFCIAEKIGSTTPILIDVDLKIEGSNAQNLYSRDQVIELIIHIQQILMKNLIGIKNEDLICFVLEKDPRIELCFLNGISHSFIKHGFHLHFPKIFVSVDDFKSTLFSLLKENSPFSLDDVVGKPWLMYGSRKNRISKPFLFSFAFDGSVISENVSDVLSFFKVYNVDGQELFFNNVRDMLPRILSVNPIGKRTFKLVSLKSKEIAQYRKRDEPESGNGVKSENDLMLASKLLDVLDVKRSFEYKTWWEVGLILYNVGEGSSAAFELFNYFSSKAQNYDANSCDKLWQSMATSKWKRKMGSLIFLCRLDDPVATSRILYEWKLSTDSNIPNTEYRIAHQIFELYPDKFIYCSRRKWFTFKNHIWSHISEPALSFIPLFISMSDWYRKREDYKENQSNQNLVKKLENSSSQKNIINQATFLYHHHDIYELMDNNKKLIAFKNGVFDLETFHFRDGLPYDFLSKQMPIAYKIPSQESINALDEFLQAIFPDKELLEFFLFQECEVFEGGNREKLAVFWTGSGNNGKTVTQKLFEKMLGPYSIKLPTTVLTGKKVQAGGAHPEVARLKYGVRRATCEEFNSEEQIETGTMKHYTGNDSLFARKLYEIDGEDFVPMFKLIVICNRLPILKNPDEATWNRIRVIPFESTFSFNHPQDRESQIALKHFPCDPNIEQRFDELAETFAFVLLNILKKKRLLSYTVKIPEKVVAAHLQYQKKCNRIAKFAEEMLERISSADYVDQDFEEMYQTFKEWWNINYARNELPDYDSFKQEMHNLQNQNCFFKIKRFSF